MLDIFCDVEVWLSLSLFCIFPNEFFVRIRFFFFCTLRFELSLVVMFAISLSELIGEFFLDLSWGDTFVLLHIDAPDVVLKVCPKLHLECCSKAVKNELNSWSEIEFSFRCFFPFGSFSKTCPGFSLSTVRIRLREEMFIESSESHISVDLNLLFL